MPLHVYDTLDQLIEADLQTKNSFGFDDWTIARITHVSDSEYYQQRITNADELGYQPLMLTLADPLERKSKQIIVKNINDQKLLEFIAAYSEKFTQQFQMRFGSFRPETFHAFAEYDNWNSFYATWLERDGKSVMNQNMPLLMDHMPKVEYWSRKQTGQQVLPYQRLLITTFFVSRNQFFDFFVKNVSDHEMERIKLLLTSRVSLSVNDLFGLKREVIQAPHGA